MVTIKNTVKAANIKYAVCRDRSSGNGYGEAGFESGPGAERGQTESKEQGTEEDQKDGTQKDETQKDGMEITEPEQTETGITEPAAGESASTAEPEAPQSVPGGDHRNRRRTA